jgi:hypothetical protein
VAYPSPADFNSPEYGSAWYVSARAGRTPALCSGTGLTFLSELQTELQNRLQTTGPLSTYDGTQVSAMDVPATFLDPATRTVNGPGWDAGTLRALWAVANHDRAPSDALAAVATDATNAATGSATAGPISARTLQTALWVRYLNQGVVQGTDTVVYGQGSIDEARVDPNSSLSLINVPPPAPSSGAALPVACTNLPASAPVPAVPAPKYGPFTFNEWLVIGVLAAAGVGAALIRSRAPRQEEILTGG